jgi:hypothetical protein
MSEHAELNYAMDAKEFQKYIIVLQAKEFSLYPCPDGMNSFDRFEYVNDDGLHLVVRHVKSSKEYHIALAVIEFANPGVLRLIRQMKVFNGSFV